MALNIPMPDLPGNALLKGIQTGSDLYSRIMNPILQREANTQRQKQFEDEMKLRKAQFERSGANMDLQRALLQQQLIHAQHGNDPNWDFNNFMNMASKLGGGNNEINMDSLKNNPLLRGYFKHKFGVDLLAETPQEKRELDLQNKIKFEDAKTQNKARALEDKEMILVKKDLPTLEKSLKSVDKLLKIAQSNPDMFGHGFMPDRYAKTTKIKDFGEWQNLISDAIVGLEQKLSAKGNVTALKMAAQLKPSHAEQQQVAIGKLESMRQQLVDSINNSRNLLGRSPSESNNENQSQYNDNDLVIVEGPNGKETMTYAQAKSLGAK